MRVRLWLPVVLSAISLAGVASSQEAPECFSVVWHDSIWGRRLPDSVRLDRRPDTLLGPRYSRWFILSAPDTRQESGPRWRGLMNAWWLSSATDSLVLVLDTPDAGWTARLARRGDSLVGNARFHSAGATDEPFAVSGSRYPCPPLPPAPNQRLQRPGAWGTDASLTAGV